MSGMPMSSSTSSGRNFREGERGSRRDGRPELCAPPARAASQGSPRRPDCRRRRGSAGARGRQRGISREVGRCRGRAASGKRTMNSLPNPRPPLRASTLPPCISVIPLTNANPIPSPPSDLPATPLTCENISKISGIDSGAMPIPLSLIDSSNVLPCSVHLSLMWPPGSLYFAAFINRFEMTCERRRWSASSRMVSAGRLHLELLIFAVQSRSTASMAASITGISDSVSFLSCVCPG